MQIAKHLAVLYGLAAFSGACASATLIGLWLHWRDTLNHCARIDCGCILYAVATFSDIVGGASPLCQFTAFAPLPATFFAACLAVVYFYRGFIRPKGSVRLILQYSAVNVKTQSSQATGVMRRIQVDNTRPMTESRRKYFIAQLAIQAAFAGIVAMVQTGQAAVLTDGFNATCREYRKTVMKHLDASGNLANMINSRMTCTTVFDFMDYMKPDFHKIYGPDIWTRSGRQDWDPGLINTGAAFVFALIFSWAHLGLWVVICVYTAMQTRLVISGRYKENRGPVMDTAL